MKLCHLLIADSDLEYAYSLRSDLLRLNAELVIDCSSSAEHALFTLSTIKYDILICDNDLCDNNGTALKELVRQPELALQLKSIIPTTQAFKPINPVLLYNRILSIITNTKTVKTLDERITSILLTCGIIPHIRGFRYLRNAIKLVCTTPCDHELKVTKDVYPVIADMHNTLSSRIERGIRHAIESAWEKGKISGIHGLLGLELYDKSYKPTNWEFIRLISDQLMLEDGRIEPLND